MHLLEIYEVFSLLRKARVSLVSECKGDDSDTEGRPHHIRVQLEMMEELTRQARRALASHMGFYTGSDAGVPIKTWKTTIRVILDGEPK